MIACINSYSIIHDRGGGQVVCRTQIRDGRNQSLSAERNEKSMIHTIVLNQF